MKYYFDIGYFDFLISLNFLSAVLFQIVINQVFPINFMYLHLYLILILWATIQAVFVNFQSFKFDFYEPKTFLQFQILVSLILIFFILFATIDFAFIFHINFAVLFIHFYFILIARHLNYWINFKNFKFHFNDHYLLTIIIILKFNSFQINFKIHHSIKTVNH